MRIPNKAALDALTRENRLSGSAATQIQRALSEASPGPRAHPESISGRSSAKKAKSRKTKVTALAKGESKGEASVRMALLAAFGDWHQGGEVIQELIPFRTRRFRADFAIPRAKVTVEVQGWSHHGRSLSDHHGDRERDMFFAKHNWLAFNISHGQALNQTGELIDAISHVLTLRDMLPRDAIQVEPVEHKHGIWWRLITPI
ncbi:MAG: hypothetical protein AWU57_319 [Marinobacter sp. T13-3]|nr:MAG: hypothetical protein AWU57_319 [Marinobacter sp. T13-3]